MDILLKIERSVLRECGGHGYGGKPSHIELIELYGIGGIKGIEEVKPFPWVGDVLRSLGKRGLVVQAGKDLWATTDAGEQRYRELEAQA